MVNFETLPRYISSLGKAYALNVHITAWNKLCISYQLLDKPTIENNIYYNIFSQVVEPNTDKIEYSEDPLDIVDVPTFESAVNIISARINNAVSKNKIKILY